MKRLMMLGPPGAGKGTQAQKLVEAFEIPQISTGDLLRAAKRNGTELGKQAAPFMDNGKLVPDALVIGMVKERITLPDAKNGYIFDGFPRTRTQSEALDEMDVVLDHVISIEVSEPELIRRLAGRRSCKECKAVYHLEFAPPTKADTCDKCGCSPLIQRSDDQPAKIKQRLIEYAAETSPLIEFYQGKGILVQIDGEGDPKEIKKRIQSALGT